jgi:hypothetical protein
MTGVLTPCGASMESLYPIRVQSRGRLFGMGHLWRQGTAKLCQSPSRVRATSPLRMGPERSPDSSPRSSTPAAGLRRDCNGGRLACEHSAPLAITPRLSVRPPDGHIRLMKARAAESNVVKFLRVALVDGAHAVTRLEASARAAGLLNERQRITHTRAFRQAKKSLRIRLLRAGFGSRSHWLWELPREESARAERKAAPLRRKRLD